MDERLPLVRPGGTEAVVVMTEGDLWPGRDPGTILARGCDGCAHIIEPRREAAGWSVGIDEQPDQAEREEHLPRRVQRFGWGCVEKPRDCGHLADPRSGRERFLHFATDAAVGMTIQL